MWIFGDAATPGSDSLWIGGAIGALIAGIPAVGALILTILKARADHKKTDRVDALKEWEQIVDRLQKRADEQEKQIYSLHKDHVDCERHRAELAAEVKILQMQVRRLQIRGGDMGPATVSTATVTADYSGRIVNVSPTITPIFHWFPVDLLRKKIEVLIPERLRGKHGAAFESVARSGMPPDPDKTVLTHGLTKEGEEVPISINLSRWQDNDGQWFVNAEIRRRSDGGDSTVIKKSDLPDIS